MDPLPAQTPVGQSFQNQDATLPSGPTPVRKFINLTTWILLGLFAPITVLILLSQNSLPGDLFYPVKTGFEGIILAAASVSPATKAAFRTDLADRRFNETQELLISRADITSLPEFVNEVQTTQDEIAKLTDVSQKAVLQKQLDQKIDGYEQQLRQTEVTIAAQNLTPIQQPSQSNPVQNNSQNSAGNVQTPQNQQSQQQGGQTTVIQNIYYVYPTQTQTQNTTPQQPTAGQTAITAIDTTITKIDGIKNQNPALVPQVVIPTSAPTPTPTLIPTPTRPTVSPKPKKEPSSNKKEKGDK